VRITLRRAMTIVAGLTLVLAVIASGRKEVCCVLISAITSVPPVLFASKWVNPGSNGGRSAFDSAGLVLLYLLFVVALSIAMIVFAFNYWNEDAH
jgi:hypothetical protein